jgi:CDP-diacylglycerol---serine O-phosphatidyltransferase
VIVAGGIYTACAAFRLARYNVNSVSPAPTPGFTGLPSPAAAAAIVSLLFLRHKYMDVPAVAQHAHDSLQNFLGDFWNIDRAIVAFLVFFLMSVGVLMVSQVPYPHVGNRLLGGRKSFTHVFVLLLCGFLLFQQPVEVVFLIANGYVVYGLIVWIARGRPHPAPAPAAPAAGTPAHDAPPGASPAPREPGPGDHA